MNSVSSHLQLWNRCSATRPSPRRAPSHTPDCGQALLKAATANMDRPRKPPPTFTPSTPTTASGIVRYLWEEAYPGGATPSEGLRLFSDAIEYQDFNYREPFVGKGAVRAFVEVCHCGGGGRGSASRDLFTASLAESRPSTSPASSLLFSACRRESERSASRGRRGGERGGGGEERAVSACGVLRERRRSRLLPCEHHLSPSLPISPHISPSLPTSPPISRQVVVNGQDGPSGISFYEVDTDGKACLSPWSLTLSDLHRPILAASSRKSRTRSKSTIPYATSNRNPDPDP